MYFRLPKRSPTAFSIFFISLVVFIVLPAAYIYLTKSYSYRWTLISFESYDQAAGLYLLISVVTLILTFFSYLCAYSYLKNRLSLPKPVLVFKHSCNYIQLSLNPRRVRLILSILLIASTLFAFLYFFWVGLPKLSALGSAMTAYEFRFSQTFDDNNAWLNNILQIIRRLVLPLLVVFLFAYSPVPSSKQSALRNPLFLYSLVLLVFCSIITLDRAPVISVIAILSYLYFSYANSNRDLLLFIPIVVVLVGFFGSILSFYQHNITSFNVEDIVSAFSGFLFGRVLGAPSMVGAELSTALFPIGSEFLWLKYSRIGVVFGAQRIGSQAAESIYVGPVSFIGDIWRNSGFYGVIMISLFLGVYLAYLDVRASNPLSRFILGVLLIALVFYLTHGVFFSAGVFLLFFVLPLVPSLFSRVL